MELFYETQEEILLDFSSILASEEITSADIVEAILLVKTAATDSDPDSLVTLTLGAGLSWDDTNTKILATIPSDAWGVGGLVIGGNYKFGVGYKVSSSVRFVEVCLNDSTIRVMQDFIRG